MKKITFTLLLFVVLVIKSSAQYSDIDQYCGGSGPGVCTPVALQSPGFSPRFDSLPPVIVGVPTSATIHFQNFDTLTFSGIAITVDSMTYDSISNLPAGLCWKTNSPTNTFANLENGCIEITGTPNAEPGQYQLILYVSMYTNISPAPNPLNTYTSAMGVYYYVRVNCSDTSATLPVDTNGMTAETLPPFIPYSSNNCSGIVSYQVSLGANQTVCNGSNIILTPIISGGQPPYIYAWSSTGNALNCPNCLNPQVTITQTSTYTVTVTDAFSQTSTASITYTASGSGTAPQFTATNSNFECPSVTDTTSLNITGGTAPYSILWGDGSAIDNSYTYTHNYNALGTYPIAVQDANGCTNSAFDSIQYVGLSLALGQVSEPVCPNNYTGSISVNVNSGTAPYLYYWNNGSTSDTATSLYEGSYSVTVTDVNQCYAVFNYTLVSQLDESLYVYITETDANCSNNGSVSAQTYGGVGQDAYNWSNGATTANLTNLSENYYSVTVTDSLGCMATGNSFVNSTCSGVITGYIFNDANNNCVFDNGEQGYSNMYVTASGNGGEYYGYSDNTGFYSIQVYGSGSYALTANNFYGNGGALCGDITLCGNPNGTVTIGANGDTSANNNFAITNTASSFDLTMHPGWTSADPGFQKEYWVMPYSQGFIPFTGQATVVFTFDSNLVYQNSTGQQPSVDLTAHTLTWVVDSVPYPSYDWNNVRFQNFFLVPATLPLGYLLQSDFVITPITGDCDTSNNHMHFSETVIGSHDPNEKTVSPANDIAENESVLTYTIHFQNTGTDSTNFIIIKDTLSPNLDAASVRNLASSSPYSKFTVTGTGILTWTFNPLRLVDSITNPSGSKGFVTFQVNKKANLPQGTSISNTASVYFDYNSAVVTNTVTDTVSAPTYIFEVPSISGVSVKAFPNPFSGLTNIIVTGLNEKFDFEMYDVTGRLSRRITSIQTSQFEVNRNDLAAGVYLYRIVVNNQQAAYGKLVVQ